MKRNSHTTSTKCQYQAAASKPKWWRLEKCLEFKRIKHTNKNDVPIITWKPWNPVARKKVVPYTESAIEKGASQYSKPWRAVKRTPRRIVIAKLNIDWEWFFSIRLWWVQVTVTPLLRRIIVFRSGTWNGLNGWAPKGGHISPISIEGARLLLKKAQKKEKKNKISDVIKRIIPQRMPFLTIDVWSPWWVDSRPTSRHHWMHVIESKNTPIRTKFILKVWNHLVTPVVIIRAAVPAASGHGLWSTRWNEWLLFTIIISGRWFLWRRELTEQRKRRIEL